MSGIYTDFSAYRFTARIAQIRYSKLIQSKWLGGLSLVDLEANNVALKASWVPKMIMKPLESWVSLAYGELPFKNEMIWHCNIYSDKILELFPIDDFCIQVWASWAALKKIDNSTTKEEILLQVLWFHQDLLRQGRPWIAKSLSAAGINRIQDLYDEVSSTFLTYAQTCHRFQTRINIMELNSIMSCIPQRYKDILISRSNCPVPKSFRELVLLKKKPLQYLSSVAKSLNTDRDACKATWQFELQCQIDDNTWNNIAPDVYLLTNHDYLQWFQYRFIHKILTNNVTRNKYNSEISDKCQFCKIERVTTFHLFIECQITSGFWTAWKKWLDYIFTIQIYLNPYTIFFHAYGNRNL